jgi:hypothetical protein
MEVLRAFVTFPVSFAAERFGAVRECAAVRTLVAFLMFPGSSRLDRLG